MAVLDELPPGLLDPKTAGMLQAAFGMMQASGPSRTPVSLGQVIGQGGQQGMGAYQQQMQQWLAHQRQQVAQNHQRLQLNEQKRLHDAQIKRYEADALKDAEATKLEKAQADYLALPETKKMLLLGDTAGVLAGMPKMTAANVVAYGKMMKPKDVVETPLAKLRREKAALPVDDPAHVTYENAIRKESETAKQISPTVTFPDPVTPVTIQDPANPMATVVVDGRTGRVIGKGPKLTEAGKSEQKRQFNMQGIGAVIQEADDILSGKKREGGVERPAPTPTGSGVGTGVDYAASFIGVSPKGAVEAQKIKAVAGALTAKMPRMEGPQSDKDVALYREMAAEIGNSMLPTDRRKAALETVKQLWAKYERLNPEQFQAAPQGDAPTYDPSKVRRLR